MQIVNTKTAMGLTKFYVVGTHQIQKNQPLQRTCPSGA